MTMNNNLGSAPFHFPYLRNRFLYTMIALLLPGSASAQTILSGNIGGMILSAQQSPYVVNDNCIIPDDEVVVIQKGSQLFFYPFCGLVVEGSLLAEGSGELPVLFTSINDSLSPIKGDRPPELFDWNGILVTETASKVNLSSFTLRFSVYGIKSQTGSIVIKNGIFSGNGQFNVVINDIPIEVTEGVAFNFEKHCLTYDANDATSGIVPKDENRYDVNSVVDVAGNSGMLAKAGHLFTGWNSSPDGLGNEYVSGSSFLMGTSEMRLYAMWTPATANTSRTTFHMKNNPLFKKGIPVLFGCAGIAAGSLSLRLMQQWNDYETEYRQTTSIPRQHTLVRKERPLSIGAFITGATAFSALSTCAYLLIKNSCANDHGTMTTPPELQTSNNGIALVFMIPSHHSIHEE